MNVQRVRWDYFPVAEPAKVVVKGERGSYSEPLHEGKAGAVDKAEPLVMTASEGFPCLSFVGRRHANHGSDRFVEQPASEFHGRFVTEAHPNQGDCLEDDKITGEKKTLVRFDEPDGEVVEAVGPISESEESRCVDED